MKITKRQLRKIIQEEKTKLLEQPEFSPGDPGPDDIVDGYYNAINQMVWDEWAAAGIDPEEQPEEMQYVIQALENLLSDLRTGQF